MEKNAEKNKVELNLPELENIFKKKKFKKTIINIQINKNI